MLDMEVQSMCISLRICPIFLGLIHVTPCLLQRLRGLALERGSPPILLFKESPRRIPVDRSGEETWTPLVTRGLVVFGVLACSCAEFSLHQ